MNNTDILENKQKTHETQQIDEIIHSCIDIALLKVRDLCEIKQFESRIDERRKTLKSFFEDFDENMEIIELCGDRYNIVKIAAQPKNSWEEALDRIIKKKISENLNSLYNNVNSRACSDMISQKFLCQIIDRNMRVSSLLENFDCNIETLNKYNQQYKSKIAPDLNDYLK